ncbi:3-deoxy-manno-octulosonate cytidylyltransferase [Fulvivirga lutea]|uniref:3-deoxy-manno-octulosonate cytidylyltransferase n=1 Tax=Fulvivirga lutea TaxID=2810512 RepID=A0A975A298_9BACT|nr:3-deoxy-manno-octulosonate cytidylyltransferase [Fulvivirga lutea]QSE99070.1 3-deoxy-manno-octulosonate cytidylyltransferase [Fulvivirga lutea]
MKIVGIIPARYASTRFPAKALADIGGKPMVQRVFEQASKAHCLSKVIVATDHPDIEKVVKDFGGNVCMTRADHQSGTDRCNEVLLKEAGFDYAINIQGDEPFIDPKQIELLASLLDGDTELATLVKKIDSEEELFDPSVVKCVKGVNGQALYFSRSAVPYDRRNAKSDWVGQNNHFKHIGIYAYRTDILKIIANLPPSPLENIESLEQLRWLENGYSIHVAETDIGSIGIDTPEDLKKVSQFL